MASASVPYDGGSDGHDGHGLRARARAVRVSGRGTFWSFLLAYIIAAIAMYQLVISGGVWNVLGITRILYPLSQAGVIAITDTDQGFIHGLPDPKYYAYAYDGIGWGLVALAALLFLVVWALKALQFHWLARFAGADGGYGPHARAYFYGRFINRILPFDVGKVASASALEGQGVPLDRGAQIVWVTGLFIVFETVTYALYGLVSVGISKWLSMMAWPLIIFFGCALFMRARDRSTFRDWLRHAREGIRAINTQQGLLLKLGVVSLVAFFLIEVNAYVLSQAFTGTFVIINVDFSVVMMGVVGGYVAKLIQVTPGGLGQWEWGFATALFAGGLGMPEAASLAIIVTLVRYVTGGLLMAVMMLTRGVPTELPRVLAIYTRPSNEPTEEAVS